MQLVNSDHESIQENSRVQECLENTKLVRKRVVRYIQVSEHELSFLSVIMRYE